MRFLEEIKAAHEIKEPGWGKGRFEQGQMESHELEMKEDFLGGEDHALLRNHLLCVSFVDVKLC